MKIYIVTQGEYSDYHIVATYLDKNIANDFANKMNSKIKGYSREYNVEEHEILNGVEEYKPNNEYIEINYRSDDKSISFENKNNYCNLENIRDREIYFYEEGFYIAVILLPMTVKDLLGAEKIMMEWVSQIEYELKNTFGGDLNAYKKYYNKTMI